MDLPGKEILRPALRGIIESWQSPFWADSITSIDFKWLPPESQLDIGPPYFFAEHKSPDCSWLGGDSLALKKLTRLVTHHCHFLL
jgi:hypothetical protein